MFLFVRTVMELAEFMFPLLEMFKQRLFAIDGLSLYQNF